MKKPFKYALLVTVVLYTFTACKNVPKQRVLLTNKVSHFFSNRDKKDIFKLTLTGDSILTGQVLFQIFTADKRRIFSDTFPDYDLLGDMDDTTITIKQKEDTIAKRVHEFFAEGNFFHPAVQDNDSILYDDSTYATIVEELKSYKSSTGFVYAHGYEGVYCIAYLKSKKEVVTYMSHD